MSAAEVISIYAIAAIWAMMLLNVALSIGGYIYIYRCNKTSGSIPPKDGVYPMVSVLVPAHNEALVLKRTVQALLNFDYPRDRYEIIVINDNSTDETEEIMAEMARVHPESRLMCIQRAQHRFFSGQGFRDRHLRRGQHPGIQGAAPAGGKPDGG